jgi:hypothetical protein
MAAAAGLARAARVREKAGMGSKVGVRQSGREKRVGGKVCERKEAREAMVVAVESGKPQVTEYCAWPCSA